MEKEDENKRRWDTREENFTRWRIGHGLASEAKAIKKVHSKKYRRFGDLGDR